MRWSRNLQVKPDNIPEELSIGDWDLAQRAFPFASDIDELHRASSKFIQFDPCGVYVQLQRGPVREVGVNGAQIDDLLTVGLVFLQKVNKLYPCRENSLAITKLEECLMWLEARTRDREERGVEGQNTV